MILIYKYNLRYDFLFFFPVVDEQRPAIDVQLFRTLVVFLADKHSLFENPIVSRKAIE